MHALICKNPIFLEVIEIIKIGYYYNFKIQHGKHITTVNTATLLSYSLAK